MFFYIQLQHLLPPANKSSNILAPPSLKSDVSAHVQTVFLNTTQNSLTKFNILLGYHLTNEVDWCYQLGRMTVSSL